MEQNCIGRRDFSWFHRSSYPLKAAAYGALIGFGALAHASTGLPSTGELKKMTLEELMDIEVTLVSRRPEKLTEAASAIQVITQDEIHRSGARTLPEALRLASNLQVAQINSNQWAISARGFNTTTSNKLLVMIDGRTVYTLLYSGVFWDAQIVPMENIERIEVVSGPGGTLWGANAVNGVINIITKGAESTQGILLGGGGGTFRRGFGVARYGGKIDSTIFYSVTGQRMDHNSSPLPGGDDGNNAWDATEGRVRLDWIPEEASRLTVSGEVYGLGIDQRAPGRTNANGQNLLSRWTHAFSSGCDLQAQAYFDRTHRDIPGTFGEDVLTYDLDFQHRFSPGERHTLIWGGGYRLMLDEVENTPRLAFLPARKDMPLYSGFIQDQIELMMSKLRLTLGSKFEHNAFSGFEVQPAGRLAWTPDDRQTVWSAVSRAVRSPSRIDADFFTPAPPLVPGTPSLAAGSEFVSEKLIAYEMGYRAQLFANLSMSLAAFYNQYDDVRSVEKSDSTTYTIMNGLQGDSRGTELSGSYRATSWWQLHGGYTYLEKDLWDKDGHADINRGRSEGNDPAHQVSLQSLMDLPAGFQVSVGVRHIENLPYPEVSDYSALDMNLIWQYKTLEISLAGSNLGVDQHPEFGAPATRQEIPRSFTGMVQWKL
jgi:iron complex outermembrane receptor protein